MDVVFLRLDVSVHAVPSTDEDEEDMVMNNVEIVVLRRTYAKEECNIIASQKFDASSR